MAAERSYKKSKKHKKKSKKRRHKSVSAAQFGAGLWKTWHLLSVIPAGFSKGKVGVKLEEGIAKITTFCYIFLILNHFKLLNVQDLTPCEGLHE